MHWDFDPILIKRIPFTDVELPFEIRWYGLFFALGLLLAIQTLHKAFETRGFPKKHAGSLSLWLPVGMILGAHLIHLIFYEPESFLENPRRIIEIGSGLASHGGGLGVITALALFCRKHRQSFHRYADAVMVAAVWVIPFVRVGNFFNSEIYGRATDLPWGVIFDRRGFTTPRHPSQIYEALGGFALVGVAYWVERNYRGRLRPGAILYLLLGLYFTQRVLLEYVKEYQVLSASFPLTMGQCLSLPIVALCAYMLFFSKNHNILSTVEPEPLPVRAPTPAAPSASSQIRKPKKTSAASRKKSRRRR